MVDSIVRIGYKFTFENHAQRSTSTIMVNCYVVKHIDIVSDNKRFSRLAIAIRHRNMTQQTMRVLPIRWKISMNALYM